MTIVIIGIILVMLAVTASLYQLTSQAPVSPDVIATAGHCVNKRNVTNVRFVFGFRMKNASTPTIRISNQNIFSTHSSNKKMALPLHLQQPRVLTRVQFLKILSTN